MKIERWMILLIALTLGACATAPVELPKWELAARQSTEVTDPLLLPDLCAIPSNGAWSTVCWAKLDAYDIAAAANTDVAQMNANALRKSDASYDALIQAGKLQSQLAQIRQELLEQERRARTLDNWFYRIIIAIGLGVAIL